MTRERNILNFILIIDKVNILDCCTISHALLANILSFGGDEIALPFLNNILQAIMDFGQQKKTLILVPVKLY